MGYCLSCGRIAKLHGGLCRACRSDFAVSGKVPKTMETLPRTLSDIARAAKRIDSPMAMAFLTAAETALARGSLFGWRR